MDLGYMYYVLQWLGPLGGWLFRRGMYKQVLHVATAILAGHDGVSDRFNEPGS